MSTPSAQDILHIPGKIIADPTDLSIASPFGGTELGVVSEVVWKPEQRSHPVRAPEHGGEIVDHVLTGQSPMLGFFARGFDADMWTRIWRRAVKSDKTKRPAVTYPGTLQPGFFASDVSLRLLFSPDNPEAQPGILLFNAYPLFEEAQEIPFGANVEFGTPVIFHGIRDSSNRTYEKMLLEDMTQTLP